MSVHFSKERMIEVLCRHEAWWQGTLGRPLINGLIYDAYTPSHSAKAPRISQANCHDFSWTPEEVIEAVDAELSQYSFILDGYPRFDLACFGPGVLAAFCGARTDNTSGGMWFFPCEEDVKKLHVAYDPENPWAERIKAICRAGVEKWQGSVVIGMPDLGGVMDVIASLCGTENLLFALMDEPDEVHRLILETETAWRSAYNDFAAILAPQGAYTDWNGILSRKPAYIPQCDFSYMLSPQMFREFVLPTIERDTQMLSHTIYHLDGIGQLAHLDMLLSLPYLDAVQWVYGAGQPGPVHWMKTYEKILNAGKKIMIIDDPLSNGFRKIRETLHCTPYASVCAAQKDLSQALALVD